MGSLGKKQYKEDMVLETITLSHYVEKVKNNLSTVLYMTKTAIV